MYLFNLKIIGPSFNFSKEIYSVKTELEFLLLDLRGRLLTCFKWVNEAEKGDAISIPLVPFRLLEIWTSVSVQSVCTFLSFIPLFLPPILPTKSW